MTISDNGINRKSCERDIARGDPDDTTVAEELHDSEEHIINKDGFPVEADAISEPGRNYFPRDPIDIDPAQGGCAEPDPMSIAGLSKLVWGMKEKEHEYNGWHYNVDPQAPLETARIFFDELLRM